MPLFFLLFVLVPIIELAVIIQVGSYIGTLWTILCIILTALIGVNLLRIQGISTLLKVQSRLHSGQLPANELAQGVLLALAGAFLLTPGFVTDALGFLLLLPNLRQRIAQRLLQTWIQRPNTTYKQEEQSAVIEGEYQREDP